MQLFTVFKRLRESSLCPQVVWALLLTAIVYGKTREIGKPLTIRPVAIRNVAYGADGRMFAVPNFVSAGSVALFQVTEQGAIARIPERLSEKNFVRSSGLFYLRKEREGDPSMAFISLPELLSGYSVDFSGSGTTLVVAGGNTAEVFEGKDKWDKIKTLTIGASVTRAVFSRDGTLLAVISDGKLFLFSTVNYTLITTVEPASDCRFSDAAFSNDNSRLAVFEFRSVMLDYGSRVRIYFCRDGSLDRDLPYFPVRPSSEPGGHLPLVSWAPGDTALAVTIPTAFAGRVYLIKSNDGALIKEFKGFCHAFSADGMMFAVRGTVFSTGDWSALGKIPRSSVACAFSPTERVIIVVTQDSIRRFRIEE
ncbi:MAG: hypothetical protein JW913_12335 [Chitinispirillaceae bacterium]|nr:hypothetical protein [Chitinispirillaceae bacterium]